MTFIRLKDLLINPERIVWVNLGGLKKNKIAVKMEDGETIVKEYDNSDIALVEFEEISGRLVK